MVRNRPLPATETGEGRGHERDERRAAVARRGDGVLDRKARLDLHGSSRHDRPCDNREAADVRERQASEPAVRGRVGAHARACRKGRGLDGRVAQHHALGSPVVPLVATTRASPSSTVRRRQARPSRPRHRGLPRGAWPRRSARPRALTGARRAEHCVIVVPATPQGIGEARSACHSEGHEASHAPSLRGWRPGQR